VAHNSGERWQPAWCRSRVMGLTPRLTPTPLVIPTGHPQLDVLTADFVSSRSPATIPFYGAPYLTHDE
jgi:hypothetical protein